MELLLITVAVIGIVAITVVGYFLFSAVDVIRHLFSTRKEESTPLTYHIE